MHFYDKNKYIKIRKGWHKMKFKLKIKEGIEIELDIKATILIIMLEIIAFSMFKSIDLVNIISNI